MTSVAETRSSTETSDETLKKTEELQNLFNSGQKKAFELLRSKENVFLTGSAGTGKSFVLKEYLKSLEEPIPVLASSGAAAVLIEGRTFHSYFGLGIMAGGLEQTIKRALKSDRVYKRIAKDQAVVIDEISMIHPEAFWAANLIAQKIRHNDLPFGGMRLIVVGDFLQLPPVDPYAKKLPWLFESQLWKSLHFKTFLLTEAMRAKESLFLKVQNHIRRGEVNSEVREFLNAKTKALKGNFEGTLLFGRRAQAEAYNFSKLNSLKKKVHVIPTEVYKKEGAHPKIKEEKWIAMTPLTEELHLKEGALVMLRRNDPNLQYVNGSLAKVLEVKHEVIRLQLLSGSKVNLTKEDFQVLDADGKVQAVIRNFPLSLAWATTIHKSQGASIDRIHVDLKRLWEAGQAYVAISRAKSSEGLSIEAWGPGSIKADPRVVYFYEQELQTAKA